MEMIRNVIATIIIYARYSTDEQRRNLSIETQVGACQKFISRMWPQETANIVILKDEGISGMKMMRRPGFTEMMRLVRQGGVTRVITHMYDRLGRNQPDTEIAARKMERLGTEVWSTCEDRDPFVRQVVGAANEKRLRDDAIKSRAGMCELARRGFPPGGPVPYGWRGDRIDDPEGKRDREGRIVQRTIYKIMPEEASSVVRAYTMSDQGKGIGTIARTFNDDRVAPPQGGTKGWDPLTIRHILQNPKYVGILRFNVRHFVLSEQETRIYRVNPMDDWIEAESPHIPPIVGRDLWDRVQAKFAKRRGTGRKGPLPRYMLSGTVVCGTCGAPCQVTSSDKKGHRYRYLRCPHAIKRGKAICLNKAHASHDWALALIVAELERGLFTEENIAYLTRRVQQIVGELLDGTKDDRTILDRQLSDVERKIANLVSYVEEHGGSDPDLGRKLRERREERNQLQARISSLVKGTAGIPNPMLNVENKVRNMVGKTAKMLAGMIQEPFREELKRHIKTAELHEDGRIRVVGTLEGLLQGTTLQCNLVAGDHFPDCTEPLPTFEFWLTPHQEVA